MSLTSFSLFWAKRPSWNCTLFLEIFNFFSASTALRSMASGTGVDCPNPKTASDQVKSNFHIFSLSFFLYSVQKIKLFKVPNWLLRFFAFDTANSLSCSMRKFVFSLNRFQIGRDHVELTQLLWLIKEWKKVLKCGINKKTAEDLLKWKNTLIGWHSTINWIKMNDSFYW